MSQLYDRIGIGYDTTQRPDPVISERLGRHLTQDRSGNYLDIACGTRNYTSTLAQDGGGWTGIELSSKMLIESSGK